MLTAKHTIMLAEAVRIFGISIFEILLNCVGFIVFLVFLSKFENLFNY